MNNVKEYRREKGYIQKEMAKYLGIEQGSYSDKERGRRGFTIEEALLLEEILGVSVKELFKKEK